MDIIQQYYSEHKSVFEENFNKALNNFDAEAIHKMRTSTKRLRALFRLIQFLSPGKFKAKKQLKKLRNLFRHAGKIREIQVEEMLVYELEEKLDQNFVEYSEYLLIREHREIARFLKSIPKLSDRKKILNDEYILKTIKSIKSESLSENAKKFLTKKILSIKKLNSKAVSIARIHRNRTLLKQIYYLYDILSNLTGQEKIMNVSKERMREIEQQIGRWHDKVNSFHYLNAFFRTKNGKKTERYKNLKYQIITDRNKMRKEIVQILKKEI